MKLSNNKTNSSFAGDFITTYYRYDSVGDMFVGLFQVTSNGVDTCTYHKLMGTSPISDEDFSYSIDNKGRITLFNNISDPVISASINQSEDCYIYASIMPGFSAFGYGVKQMGALDSSDIEGEYKLMQIRFADSYSEQSGSLLSIYLKDDGSGTYQIDTNTHGENNAGTLTYSYQGEGVWEIVLDGDSDYTIYGAFNPTEKLLTGYFNFGGNSPGIIFGIEKFIPANTYTISGVVTGADNVDVSMTGDASGSQIVAVAGGAYNFTIEEGQSVIISPEKNGYTFTPASISITNATENLDGQDFSTAPLVSSLNEFTNDFKIYPNPVQNTLTVEAEGLLSIELIDIRGEVQQIINCKSQLKVQIDTGNLTTGIYILKLTSVKGIVIKNISIR